MIRFGHDRLNEIFTAFTGKRILVVGDLMLDEYLLGSVTRISPEAPVPVIEINNQQYRLGGAANVAANINTLGCEPVLIGILGKDQSGEIFASILSENGISSDGLIYMPDRPTTVKTRIIGDSQHIARVDKEVSSYLDQNNAQKVIKQVQAYIKNVDAVILQDYNKGILGETVIEAVIKACLDNDILVTVDPKFKNFMHYRQVSLFKPNIKETEAALAVKITSENDLLEAGQLLLKQLEAESILITRGSQGMSLFEPDTVTHVPTRVRNVVDVSGAGDTVISTLTAALSGVASRKEAATLANYAAGIVCEEVGIIPIAAKRLFEVCIERNS